MTMFFAVDDDELFLWMLIGFDDGCYYMYYIL